MTILIGTRVSSSGYEIKIYEDIDSNLQNIKVGDRVLPAPYYEDGYNLNFTLLSRSDYITSNRIGYK